jgi:hypothetical protein
MSWKSFLLSKSAIINQPKCLLGGNVFWPQTMGVIFHETKWEQWGGERLLPRIISPYQGPHSIISHIRGPTASSAIRAPQHHQPYQGPHSIITHIRGPTASSAIPGAPQHHRPYQGPHSIISHIRGSKASLAISGAPQYHQPYHRPTASSTITGTSQYHQCHKGPHISHIRNLKVASAIKVTSDFKWANNWKKKRCTWKIIWFLSIILCVLALKGYYFFFFNHS